MSAPSDAEIAKQQEHLSKCHHKEIGSGTFRLVVNPVVFITSTFCIWLFVILCIASPDYMLKAMNTAAFDWITEVWTWLYILSQDVWIVVLLYVMLCSKYGNIKLGKDEDEPEYSLATWFSMLFSAGVAVGLFYYSVAEPLWHYKGWGGARWTAGVKGYGNNNEDSIHAIMITYFHWGLHGWIPYTTMGAVLGLMTYRRGFPMTIRYCFWPLIGEKCYGWMGDAIDILSIMTTIFGVCTSLGLGAMQLNAGLQRINHGFYQGVNYAIPNEDKYATPTCGGAGNVCAAGMEAYGIQTNVPTQIIIIFFITCIATCSVITGLNRGIVNLSRVTFSIGMFLLLTVLFLGETYFALDVTVQSFGYYIWYLVKISFQTDAFERLGSKMLGLGGSPDGNSGGSGWLAAWTLFYWGWWISWGPFVGTFLAKISKGRTLRQFIFATLIVPSIYSFMWFGVFGSEGIRMQRMADGSGVCSAAYAGNKTLCVGDPAAPNAQVSSKCAAYSARYSDAHKESVAMGWTPDCVLDSSYHGGYGKCAEFAWTRHVVVADQCVESTVWVSVPCGTGADPTALAAAPTTGPCANTIIADHLSGASKRFNHFPVAANPSCFVPAQDNIVCLYNQGTEDIFFDQINSYGPRGFSDMLSVISILALALYFVTSSDSGSYVVDMISANGHHDPPVIQRIFWSFTEGATACALLAAGRNLPNSQGSLRALQAVSILMGLPYTFVLFWCSQALLLLVKEESGELAIDRKAFSSFLFAPPMKKCIRLVINTALPGVTMGKAAAAVGGWPMSGFGKQAVERFWGAVFQAMYLAAAVLVLCAAALYQWCIIGLVVYIGFGTFLGFLRTGVRGKYQIQHGDIFTDLLCAIFAPMFTLVQLESALEENGALDNGGKEEAAPATV
mmetsp:Transcript_31451/g.93412  ORF Transcript_31451/g.93412 Transcript_31451/m.93412 type:complete len:897 (-) Transcript_31451:24-2714(-)